ncbi:MAG: MerR family transcriptional regulator [Lachnospiraceae bacterium]|nr:MerR family transcriptional regulator [Lachnospiraceae bacterium]
MKDMTLREVCSAIGVSRRAIQGYEKESLVSATGKNNRGYLLYDTAAQERIKKIKLYQDMGFSLKQIKLIIDDSGPILKNALIQQQEKLNQEVEQKTTMIRIIQEMLKNLS